MNHFLIGDLQLEVITSFYDNLTWSGRHYQEMRDLDGAGPVEWLAVDPGVIMSVKRKKFLSADLGKDE